MNFQDLNQTFLFCEQLKEGYLTQYELEDFDRNELEIIKAELLSLPDREEKIGEVIIASYRSYRNGHGLSIKIYSDEGAIMWEKDMVTHEGMDRYLLNEVILFKKVINFLYKYLEVPE